MSEQLTMAQLMDWLEEILPPHEKARVAALVEQNPTNQEVINWLRSFLKTAEKTAFAEPGFDLFESTIAQFRSHFEEGATSLWPERVLATLQFDSAQRFSLAGVRHNRLQGIPRQLVYSTEMADIALYIQPAETAGTVDLDGQIFSASELFGDELAAFTVQIINPTDNREAALVYGQPLGKFRCQNLFVDEYDLIIQADRVEITIPKIQLNG